MVSNKIAQGTSREAADGLRARPSCAECGTLLLTHTLDRDKRQYVWCRLCGLIHDPDDKMGKTIKSLMRYMVAKKMTKEARMRAQAAYDAYGLRAARIATGRMLNDEVFPSARAVASPEPDDTSELV